MPAGKRHPKQLHVASRHGLGRTPKTLCGRWSEDIVDEPQFMRDRTIQIPRCADCTRILVGVQPEPL